MGEDALKIRLGVQLEKLLSTIVVGYGDCRQLVWDGSGAHAIKKCGNPYEVAGRAGAHRRYRDMT